MSRQRRPQFGMICANPDANGVTIAERLGLPNLTDIVISGWDTIDHSVEQALNIHQVLSKTD